MRISIYTYTLYDKINQTIELPTSVGGTFV